MEIGTKVRMATEVGRNPGAGKSLANIARKMGMTSLNVTGYKIKKRGKIILTEKIKRAIPELPLSPNNKI